MDHVLWDDMASDYDKSVEDNQDPIIASYLDREIEILSSLCKSICKHNKNCCVIDMGSGTGRAVFALDEKLQNDSIRFYGVEVSEPMIRRANQKKQDHKGSSEIRFLKYDLRDPDLFGHFESGEANIVMCLYNTLGVIPSDRRQAFVNNMTRIAGDKGLAIISAFNGDDFGFVAPRLYHPMLPMIKKIDRDSFDEKNRVFQNSLGFCSQWFTKDEIKSLLHTSVEPVPIDVQVDGKSYTFGNVFSDRSSKMRF